ncbi:MAG: hypothetical protein PHY09_05215 [Desulfuromonadaceae bacterium]|nr:hypothetical protein [Desulfuromonadaceae bacterium]MDD5106187.1 hypothetical protein [Desulfuromonadaceae bacterium]
MDVSAISGTAVMMLATQTKENISVSLMKMANDQQQQVATMIAQGAQGVPSQSDFSFSIYA